MSHPVKTSDGVMWYPFRKILSTMRGKIHSGTWLKANRLKYIDVRIDTRTGLALLKDRHGTPMSLEEFDALLTRAAETSEDTV